jgi:hypothetical protein
MRVLTVRELKQLIYAERDETVVLLPGPDHSYRRAAASIALARFHCNDGWSEDDGDDATTNDQGTRFRALIIQ